MDAAESKVEPTPQGATATPVDAPPHSATPLIVTVVVAVLVGAGGLIFTMLNTRATAAATAIATAPMAARTAVPSAASVAAFSAPKWSHAHAYRWVSNRPRSVAFELESIERVPVWTTTVRPMLVVRCLSRKDRAVRLHRDRRPHRVRRREPHGGAGLR